jgi:CDP-diacylglycerol---serine O-phosphatidyltransferase
MKTKEERIKPVKIKPVKIKKRRLKYIAVLPSFITLMNGACGFIAIVFACRSAEVRWDFLFMRNFNMTSYTLAGYMVFLAMIADMMDGRVARLTRTTSSFGGQLDSLSDAISFGVAPAFLMMKVVEYHIENLSFGHFRFSLLLWRSIFFSAIFYAMCAIVRLARFNVENEENEAAHMNFAGLPSPAAAGVIVSLVIIHQQILPRIISITPDNMRTFEIITISAFPIVTFLSGILMVSRIRYPHLANQLLRGKKSLAMLLLFFACGLFIIWNIQLAMVAGFCGFAFFGVFRWLILGVFRKLRRHQPDAVV